MPPRRRAGSQRARLRHGRAPNSVVLAYHGAQPPPRPVQADRESNAATKLKLDVGQPFFVAGPVRKRHFARRARLAILLVLPSRVAACTALTGRRHGWGPSQPFSLSLSTKEVNPQPQVLTAT